MGRAIDMFVTYRFVKLLTQPFDKTDAFKMGIIDDKGNRTDKKLYKASEQSAYTVLHKLVFNIKKIFQKEVTLDNGKLSKGIYILTQDVIITDEEQEDFDALEGDEVEVFEDTPPADTILGVDVFAVIHNKTKQKIFISSEDIKELDIGDL